MGYFNASMSFSFDYLSLFFLAVIAVVSVPSAVYSVGYLKGEYPRAKIIFAWFLLVMFILAMVLVVTVSNAFVFLIVWETMSLVSYFLVTFDNEQEKSLRAGIIYIVMTHVGTALITAAILTMFQYSHSFDFAALKSGCQIMPENTKNFVFILLFFGFGAKAGVVPLHIWLPYAHPQAPSHVSGIMSGVMIKIAIYGILRFVICILGVTAMWWGNMILIIASISCVVGVMYALMEHDIKKLLAYHSVENIGIILLGIGAGMVFLKMDLPVLAVFAFCAGLYHLINHAIFKGLLFLCAGSVYKATGTRDIEKLGGLIKVMPRTALFFLIGSIAISGLPPLNGFVSEWLTLQAFFLGALAGTAGTKIFMGLCAAVLALTGGLAAACFAKAFGVTFLAMPRSARAANAKEVSLSMKSAMFFLSLLTVIFGLFPAVIMKILVKVSGEITGIDTAAMSFSLNNFSLAPQPANRACLSNPLLALILIFFSGLAAAVYYLLPGRRNTVKNRTWDCGYYKLDSRNEYTATAFSKPFRAAFSFFFLPYRKTEKIRESFYHVKYFKYETFTTPIFKQYIYDPIVNAIFMAAGYMRRIQRGSIHLYIAYIFITLLGLIIFYRG